VCSAFIFFDRGDDFFSFSRLRRPPVDCFSGAILDSAIGLFWCLLMAFYALPVFCTHTIFFPPFDAPFDLTPFPFFSPFFLLFSWFCDFNHLFRPTRSLVLVANGVCPVPPPLIPVAVLFLLSVLF